MSTWKTKKGSQRAKLESKKEEKKCGWKFPADLDLSKLKSEIQKKLDNHGNCQDLNKLKSEIQRKLESQGQDCCSDKAGFQQKLLKMVSTYKISNTNNTATTANNNNNHKHHKCSNNTNNYNTTTTNNNNNSASAIQGESVHAGHNPNANNNHHNNYNGNNKSKQIRTGKGGGSKQKVYVEHIHNVTCTQLASGDFYTMKGSVTFEESRTNQATNHHSSSMEHPVTVNGTTFHSNTTEPSDPVIEDWDLCPRNDRARREWESDDEYILVNDKAVQCRL